jgi:DNA-binding PucR family transcriptional regulator
LVTLLDGELVGFVAEPPSSALPVPVGVGPAAPLDALGDSFQLARRALASAVAFGLTGAWDIPRLGLRAAIVADPELGDDFVRRYVLPFRDRGVTQEGVLEAVKQFLACGMRTEVTAKEMHIHPNTLRYRLKRFEEETGASLRDPEQLCEIWWALNRATLTGLEP